MQPSTNHPSDELPVTPVLGKTHGQYHKADLFGSQRFPASLQDTPDTVKYERTVNSIYDSYATHREDTAEEPADIASMFLANRCQRRLYMLQQPTLLSHLTLPSHEFQHLLQSPRKR